MTNRTKTRAQKRAAEQVSGRRNGTKGRTTPGPRSRWPFVVIAGVVVAIVLIVVLGPGLRPSPPSVDTSASAAAIQAVTGVPDAALEEAGVPTEISIDRALPADTPLLQRDGKPEILYVGAEYCPYCAAHRWPLIIALSRFGTFSGLMTAHSSSLDFAPNTNTFSLANSFYESPYIAFTSVETADENGQRLEIPTPHEERLLRAFDPAGSIPFVLYGNRYVTVGSAVPPEQINGLSYQQLATAITDPASSPVGAQIDAQANVITAAICQLTGGEPGDVCRAAAVQRATTQLPEV